MDFERRRRVSPHVNLSALIDVAFILVIFIVLAANFDRVQRLGVSLPDAEASQQATPTSLTVTIPADGPVIIEDAKVEMEDVGDVLRGLKSKYKSVLLMADKRAHIQRAVEILGLVRGAGFDAVGIATETKGSP
tara:strand:- start:386 stop:787 length:402 start_codon:yes stop_codon:yes gene_type:complete